MNALTTWLGQNGHLCAVALLIALVVIHYLTQFVAPAMRLKRTLAQAIERLGTIKASAASQGVDLAQIDQYVMTEPRLAHLWSQYANGLHPHWGQGQTAAPASVQQSRVQALSETFFAAMKAKTGTAVVNLTNIEQQVLGDPRLALTWLVNELSGLGIGLQAGQFVTTGTCMVPLELQEGDTVQADFGALGRIGMRFGD